MIKNKLKDLLNKGVIFEDINSVYISDESDIEASVKISPMIVIKGKSTIKSGTTIGPFSHIEDSYIGPNCNVLSSTIFNSVLEEDNTIGPYGYLRNKTKIAKNAKLGSHCEINDTSVGENSKCKHFSYFGHAKIGKNVNIGAGTITCNYDGKQKHSTIIEDDAFIGSNSLLIAPLLISRGAYTGAGTVVIKDIEAYNKIVGVPGKVIKKVNP
ncbi:DapH/DapD/GlmU-related protein [Halalkalibacter sp. APA_J-10(15)]|uniref:DapH/DapD/GlmU-related protein n=1 Tax=Halalkalibacter sp. APA_J-10(15) TaxID=2933805 RepID=UPI001FF38690|nr:DapH/DapD/GlmU-related protein [Halalkalibacter sp. APA_J-10(15)]MCK0473048.1 hypothetical protein [Halalkalibacter sp. APA_J-10(15)]